MDEFRLFNDAADSKVETFLPQSTEYCLPRRQFSKIIPPNQLNWRITQCQKAALSKSCYLKVFDTLQAIKQCSRSPIIFGNRDSITAYLVPRAPPAPLAPPAPWASSFEKKKWKSPFPKIIGDRLHCLIACKMSNTFK